MHGFGGEVVTLLLLSFSVNMLSHPMHSSWGLLLPPSHNRTDEIIPKPLLLSRFSRVRLCATP